MPSGAQLGIHSSADTTLRVISQAASCGSASDVKVPWGWTIGHGAAVIGMGQCWWIWNGARPLIFSPIVNQRHYPSEPRALSALRESLPKVRKTLSGVHRGTEGNISVLPLAEEKIEIQYFNG